MGLGQHGLFVWVCDEEFVVGCVGRKPGAEAKIGLR